MKIALVHDYIKEYGGAERVLEALHEIWPKAPIYTAFCVKNSTAGRVFANTKIIESWLAPLIKHKNLHSPLRFLTPFIWENFDFSRYDLVLSSASWYITKPIRIPRKVLHICYCHTPSRFLYGYPTAVEWQRYLPIRIYGNFVAHFLRMYDFQGAQRVGYFIANSKNVAKRIKKFYRQEATVIYPPVEVEKIKKATRDSKPKDYYLVASRIVGAKGLAFATQAARKLKIKIKVAGEPAGLRWEEKKLAAMRSKYIEFLGRVSDKELYKLYGECRAYLALATDEDFGITPVEAMAAGRPVIAFRGGGYLESVVDPAKAKRLAGQEATGVFFDEPTVESLVEVLKKFKPEKYKPEDCRKQAKKFSKERFKREMRRFVEKKHA